MNARTPNMAQLVAETASALQQQRTGFAPKAVTVVLSGETLVITLHGALSPAAQAVASNAAGAAKIQEYHRQLFASSADPLRQEIKRITGVDIRETATAVEPTSGAVVHAFSGGTMVQMFLLSGQVATSSFTNHIPPTTPTPIPT
jgi:uncharacterized protein YbcI